MRIGHLLFEAKEFCELIVARVNSPFELFANHVQKVAIRKSDEVDVKISSAHGQLKIRSDGLIP